MYGALFKGRYSFVNGYSQQLLLIVGYVFNGMPEKVLQMFDRMLVQPDEVIATILFNACAKVADPHAMKLGKIMLTQLPAAFFKNSILMNSATDMLMKFGEVQEAEHLFSRMKKRDAAAYGVMMNGYNINGLPEKALYLFEQATSTLNAKLYTIMYSTCAALSNDRAITLGKQLLNNMPQIFKEDLIVIGSAIHMLMKFGEVQEAEHLFSCMKKRDASSYGVMMNGYNLNSEPQKCLKLLEEAKQRKVKLNEPMCVSLVGACSKIGMISMCREVVEQIPMESLNNSIVKSCLIDMWVSVLFAGNVRPTFAVHQGKSGAIEEAKQMFQSINEPTAVAYSCMSEGYVDHSG
jgi:pentatricopeptide repeat protein